MSLDTDIRSLSAFNSFRELLDDMSKTGYFPTLRADAATSVAHRRAAKRVRKALHKRGLRVYPPYGAYPSEKESAGRGPVGRGKHRRR